MATEGRNANGARLTACSAVPAVRAGIRALQNVD